LEQTGVYRTDKRLSGQIIVGDIWQFKFTHFLL
jgi:hypothetical protein